MLATSRENASRQLAGNLVQEKIEQQERVLDEEHEQISACLIPDAE